MNEIGSGAFAFTAALMVSSTRLERLCVSMYSWIDIYLLFYGNRSFFCDDSSERLFAAVGFFFFFFWKKNEQKIPFFRNKKAIKNHFFVATKKGAAGLFGLVLSFSLSLSPVLEKASSS